MLKPRKVTTLEDLPSFLIHRNLYTQIGWKAKFLMVDHILIHFLIMKVQMPWLSNKAQPTQQDVFLLYAIKKGTKFDWIEAIKNNMYRYTQDEHEEDEESVKPWLKDVIVGQMRMHKVDEVFAMEAPATNPRYTHGALEGTIDDDSTNLEAQMATK
ncbi:hypothetical protein RIF29_27306 [Crotalaria pallida]|uniref:Uncharacterized protein n=1 Tax=Crotalaria pallida TaxID=3830 RepID=A0AAN9EW21_CROPI